MPQVVMSELIQAAIAGRVVSFPTDTVPALAVRPDQAEQIFITKQRGRDKPLILIAATAADLWPYVTGSPEEQQIWQQVAEHYWPGALTLVLPASDRLPGAVNPLDSSTLGIRVPNHSQAQAILAETGPLATTSANLSGSPPLETMAAIAAQFPQIATLAVEEATTTASGLPSTVVRWTGRGWKTLRQGAIVLPP